MESGCSDDKQQGGYLRLVCPFESVWGAEWPSDDGHEDTKTRWHEFIIGEVETAAEVEAERLSDHSEAPFQANFQ